MSITIEVGVRVNALVGPALPEAVVGACDPVTGAAGGMACSLYILSCVTSRRINDPE